MPPQILFSLSPGEGWVKGLPLASRTQSQVKHLGNGTAEILHACSAEVPELPFDS